MALEKEPEKEIKINWKQHLGLHKNCPECGVQVKTWVSWVEVVLGFVILIAIISLQINGHYERDEIIITGCGKEVGFLNGEELEFPMSLQEIKGEDNELSEKKISEAVDKYKQEKAK